MVQLDGGTAAASNKQLETLSPIWGAFIGRERSRNARGVRQIKHHTVCSARPLVVQSVCQSDSTSVLAKRSLISETMVMAAIASIEAYSRLTQSQSMGRH
jgi:hypothetical protein